MARERASGTRVSATPIWEEALGNATAGGLIPSFTLSPERRSALHERLGRTLPDEVFTMVVTGHRVLVAPRAVRDRTSSGLLYIPPSTQERQKLEMGAGWIINAGPGAGSDAPHPGGPLCHSVSDLVGREVLFKRYSGTTIQLGEDERDEWTGALVMLTDRDILAFGGDTL